VSSWYFHDVCVFESLSRHFFFQHIPPDDGGPRTFMKRRFLIQHSHRRSHENILAHTWAVTREIIQDWSRASTLRHQRLSSRPAEISSVLHGVWWCRCLLLWSGLPCQCETRCTRHTSSSLL
jgi:hypothetical protein